MFLKTNTIVIDSDADKSIGVEISLTQKTFKYHQRKLLGDTQVTPPTHIHNRRGICMACHLYE